MRNTGLGAGTRERDMMMVQMVQQLQEKLLSSLGPVNNPYVSPDNLYNSIAKTVEAAGLKSPDLYFTKPDQEQLQKRMEADAAKPDPEMQKVQAQAQADMEKAKLQAETDRMKLEAQTRVDMAKIEAESELKRYQIDQEIQLKRDQAMAQAFVGQRIPQTQIGGQPG